MKATILLYNSADGMLASSFWKEENVFSTLAEKHNFTGIWKTDGYTEDKVTFSIMRELDRKGFTEYDVVSFGVPLPAVLDLKHAFGKITLIGRDDSADVNINKQCFFKYALSQFPQKYPAYLDKINDTDSVILKLLMKRGLKLVKKIPRFLFREAALRERAKRIFDTLNLPVTEERCMAMYKYLLNSGYIDYLQNSYYRDIEYKKQRGDDSLRGTSIPCTFQYLYQQKMQENKIL